MPGSPHERLMTAIFLEGEISANDQHRIGAFLGRLGLKSKVLTYEGDFTHIRGIEDALDESSEQLERVHDHGFMFEDLTSPRDIVVVEHLYSLAFSLKESTKASNLAWKHIVNGKGAGTKLGAIDENLPSVGGVVRWVQIAEPQPLEGIQLVKREETALPHFTGRVKASLPDGEIIARRYGVRAESIFPAVSKHMETLKGSSRKTHANHFLRLMAYQLREQLYPQE